MDQPLQYRLKDYGTSTFVIGIHPYFNYYLSTRIRLTALIILILLGLVTACIDYPCGRDMSTSLSTNYLALLAMPKWFLEDTTKT